MRPVSHIPNGAKLTAHGDAKPDLIAAMGEFCVYCERAIEAMNLDVEHIKPQKAHSKLTCTWANLLLGCTSCNTYKRHYQAANRQKGILVNQAWSHMDHTFHAYSYDQHGRVTVSSALSQPQQRMARKTLEMTGLDRTPAVDAAYKELGLIYDITSRREKAWRNACTALATYQQNPTDMQRGSILNQAEVEGFFSIWMNVFSAYPKMKMGIIRRFKATAICFDLNGSPLPPRNPGRI
jgi:uncharacterized protein (TIGR02646 family)